MLNWQSLIIIGLATLALVGCSTPPPQEQRFEAPQILPEPTMDEYCSVRPCRGDTHIFLATVEGEYHYRNDYFWPVVQDKTIRVLPGERVLVEAQIDEDGALANFQQVNEIENPDRTFEFFFRQLRGNYGMMVSMRNPFPFPIDLQVELTDLNGETRPTGTCPIRAQRSFIDQWMQPAKTLVIREIRRLEHDAPIICRV